MPDTPSRILVIKLGALGDIVLALGPFAAIRRDHPDAHVTLLTTRPYVEFLKPSEYFDDIWVDDRPWTALCSSECFLLRRKAPRQKSRFVMNSEG